MKKHGSVFLVLVFISLFLSCGNKKSSSMDTALLAALFGSTSASSTTGGATATGDSSNIDTTPFAVSVGDSASTYNSEDVLGNIAFGNTITIDFTAMTAQSGSDGALAITSGGVTPLTGVSISTTNGVTITSTVSDKIRYILAGTLSGSLTVNSSSAYQLYCNGATINGTTLPPLYLKSTQKVYIATASGTTNTISDSSSNTVKASLYGKGPMVFSGDGTLSVTGSYKHGIFSNDYIRMRGGTCNVNVTARDGIRTVNGFIFDDGNLTVNATGTATDDESKGIKVEGLEDSTGVGKGYIVINGGYIRVTSYGKAITAGWDIDEAGTSATTDDPDPYVIVNNGVITLATTGIPYDTGTASNSPEGIEGKSRLTINGGYVIINTTDDCLNAGDSLTINGGYIFGKSSNNDAIDCNGNLTIAGGVIVAIGSGAPEGSFDYDDDDPSTTYAFTISGGTFVGIGGNTAKPNSVSQNVVVLGSLTSGTTMAIMSGTTSVFAYTIPQSYATMILSSPDITTGNAFTINTGGTASADNTFCGLFLGNLSYTGGTAVSSFIATARITKLGGVYF